MRIIATAILMFFVSFVSGQKKVVIGGGIGGTFQAESDPTYKADSSLYYRKAHANALFYPLTNPSAFITASAITGKKDVSDTTAATGYATINMFNTLVAATTVTEHKSYYHGEFIWMYTIDSVTGAFVSSVAHDISDYLPIDPSTSITITSTDNRPFILYGWTYDSALNPISEIRAKSLSRTTLRTYTFTTPSNAAYYCIWTKYPFNPPYSGGDSMSVRLVVRSTNTITYSVPIVPSQFSGATATIRAQKAADFASHTSSPLYLPGFVIDSAIRTRSGLTVILQGTLLAAPAMKDNFFRNEAIGRPWFHLFKRGNKHIKIMGLGKALIQGNDTQRDTTGMNGVYYKLHMIHMANVHNLELDRLKFRASQEWTTSFEWVNGSSFTNLEFEHAHENENQDGLHFNLGCHDNIIDNIRGMTYDDIVAFTNVKISASEEFFSEEIVEPYRTDMDIYGFTVSNIVRNSRLFTFGGANYSGAIRILTADGRKIHDINFSNIYGKPSIQIQSSNNYHVLTPPTVDDVYQITVKNSDCPVYIWKPIKDCSFEDIPIYQTGDVTYSAKPPAGSLRIYRKYKTSYPEYIDSVGINNGTEYKRAL